MWRWQDLSMVRLLIFGLALAATIAVATLVTRLLVPPAPSPLHPWVALKNLLLPFLLLAVYAWTVRFLERRPAHELALSPGIALFPAGLVLGMILISAYVLVQWTVGAAQVASGTLSGGPLPLANEFLIPWLTAVGEELLFRAVLFRLTEEMLGTSAAVLLTVALFGISHAINPGADTASLTALSLGIGALLTLSFAATRSLWFPVGLHMGWNLAEGFLYGLPNSGQADPMPLAHTAVTGQPALTGGAFGPEGSVILVLLCMLASALLLRLASRTRHWQPMRLQLRPPATPVNT
jgi:uncharacterized protein